jgi:hypothetical protein
MEIKMQSPPSYADLVEMYKPSKTTTFACLVYGPSSAGKTHFAGTFPEPFFIDADRGMRSLQGELPRIQLQKAEKPFSLVLSILQDAVASRGPWAQGGSLASRKTIVIDSITALIDDYMMPEAMREGKRNFLDEKASYDEYGKIKSRMTALASVIKDLALTKYVVMTALVEEEKDENSGLLIGKPMLTGKYRDKIMADFDETYYMEAVTPVGSGNLVYKLYAQSYRWYRAKTRLTSLKVMDDPSFQKIVQQFKAT